MVLLLGNRSRHRGPLARRNRCLKAETSDFDWYLPRPLREKYWIRLERGLSILILAAAEEWSIFYGARGVLGRWGLGWLRKAWWWVGLDCRAARDSLATRVVLK